MDPFTRTFEELITERGSFTPFPISNTLFQDIYDSIREKLNAFDDSESIEHPPEEYLPLLESTESFKKEIAHVYQQKIHLSSVLETKKQEYSIFCNNVEGILNLMESYPEPDIEFCNSIRSKIDWYFSKLEIPHLLEEYSTITKKLNSLKAVLHKVSGMVNPVICGICYSNQVFYFVDPCGHSLCESCKTKCEASNKCHYCNTSRNMYRRLYL